MQSALADAFREYGFTKYAAKEFVAATGAGRLTFESAVLLLAELAAARNLRFKRAGYVCQAVRLLEGHRISGRLQSKHAEVLQDAGLRDRQSGSITPNQLRTAFLDSAEAGVRRHRYLQHGRALAAAMKFPRDPDTVERQGNLVVLKAHDDGSREKGVLYLQYTESIREFVALFDVEALAEKYRLVLEPSSWGYQDEGFLLLVEQGLDVIVQAQDEIDFAYLQSLGSNLQPMRLGAGDWIDPETFVASDDSAKEFDLVMVASWSPVKRHSLLFSALAAAKLHDLKVALVGYPWEGRTKSDVAALAKKHGLRQVTFFEKIPRAEVANVVRRSRIGIMLTRREGANRGVYECLFSGVPVILSRGNRGFNKSHINESTGVLADDKELPEAIGTLLANHAHFRPREWALAHTGYRNAWRRLNEQLAQLSQDRGESYSIPIAATKSAPAAMYERSEDRLRLAGEYVTLQRFLRDKS